MKSEERSKRFKWWKIPVFIICLLLLAVITYVLFVIITYSRIPDYQALEAVGTASEDTAKTGTEYTAMTYNIGFGAYTPDFTFFMDGGTESWAFSEESVKSCIEGDIDLLKTYSPDIALIQEVDIDSTRSYHVNEKDMILDALENKSSIFAVNYHSAFLCYPFTQPHGKSNSGLLTISDIQLTEGTRRSLPISTGFSKFIDLDRAYTINRMKTENGKELVVFNVHLSAYGTNGDLQTQQITMMCDDMKAEYEKGNYVICGGDFNHDFPGDSKYKLNKDTTKADEYAWAADFPDEMLPEHFSKATDYESGLTLPTTRYCDKPYGPDSFVVLIDGFIVSDNIEVTYTDVIDTQFQYSDHNPVVMRFKLIEN